MLVRVAGSVACILLSNVCLLGQSTPPQKESVIVTGTYEPIPLEESERAVHVFDLVQQKLLSNSLIDFLRLDSSIDVRSRAPGGVQSDISIRGGNFGQTLILLNGMRLNDVQSGHLSADIPVPLDAVARIEVLRGTGSAVYGSDAVGGVVNLITARPESTELRLRTGVGNFGTNQQSGTLSMLLGKSASEEIAFSRDFSSGFRPDRDYRNLSLASLTNFKTTLGASDVVLALNDRPYGADQFYGNYPSWERTKSWFASARQELGANMEADFAFRRHTDLFVLFRDRPQIYTNRHAVESYEYALRRHDGIANNVTVSYGLEGLHDAIDSNNLGHHQRDRGAAYAAVDIRALRRFSFQFGVREELYTGGNAQFSPTASAGYWLSPHWKLRASASRAYRLPSYTDLYYHDPANLGNANLKPEKAWGYEGGVDWNPGWHRVRGELTVFHRRERDGIDYVRSSPTDLWRATNFDRLNFTGVEAAIVFEPLRRQTFELRYTGLTGAQDVLAGNQSKYVFNYPRNQGLVSWQATLPGQLLVRTRIGVLERFQRDPYAVWDVYAASTWSKRIHPFLQLTNLTAATYQEIVGVATPGRGVLGGVEITVSR